MKMTMLFSHPLEVNIGYGRIVFMEEQLIGKTIIPAGWKLPGGGHTTDQKVAEEMARTIDQLAKRKRRG